MSLTLSSLFFTLIFQTTNFEGKWVTVDDETGVEKSIISLYIDNMTNYMEELRPFYWMRIKVRSVLIVKVQKKINPLRGYLFLKGLTKDGNSWTDGNYFGSCQW